MCKRYIPKKRGDTRSIIPKKRRKLFNKIKMLRRSKRKARNREKEEIDRRILEVKKKEILIDTREERNLREERVIDNMNTKPKLFHSLMKNKDNRDNRIGPFKIEGEYVTEN